MTTVPLAVSVPMAGCTSQESVQLARSSRTWGYRSCWAMEVDGPDAFTILGALAATTDLELGVAVVPIQTRSVFTLAMSAVSLAQFSHGRFTLGIGTSSELIVSRFGGQSFSKPLDHLREAALALRPLLRGERASFNGDHVRIGGYRPPSPPPAPVPLYFGSLNPRSLRLAGELADGICVNQVSPRHISAMLREVAAGAAGSNRTDSALPLVARIFCLVTDNAAAARSFLGHVFAPYVAIKGYNRSYRWMGYAEEAEAIAEAAAAGDRAAMAAAFSDRMARDLFVIGDADTVVRGIRDYIDAGVTVPVIAPLAPGADAAAYTLREISLRWPSS